MQENMIMDEAGENTTLDGATVENHAAYTDDTSQEMQILLQIRNTFSYMKLSIGFPIIGANLVLLICFTKFHFLKRKPNIYIFSLCVSDILAGLAAILVSSLNSLIQYHTDYRKYACIFSAVFQYFTVVTSLYSMLCAALERYIHIAHPYLHVRHEDSRIHLAIVSVGWFILAVCSVVLGYPNNAQHGSFCYLPNICQRQTYMILFPLTTLPQIVAIAVVMLLIVKLIHKHSRTIAAIEQLEMRLALPAASRIKSEGNDAGIGPNTSQGIKNAGEDKVMVYEAAVPKLANPVSGTCINDQPVDGNPIAKLGTTSEVSNPTVVNNPVAKLPAFKKVNRSRTNMVVVLLVVTLICWIPVVLTIVMRATLSMDYIRTVAWTTYGELSVFMVTFNSLLNPFLYQRFSPDIKKAYRALLQ